MNLEDILQQVMATAGTFNLRIAVLLFLICSIGEFGLAIPYLLETIWLLSGYHAGSGVIPPFHLMLLWLAAQSGRQTGASLFYYLSQFGSLPLMGLYRKHLKTSVSQQLLASGAIPARLLRRLDRLSAFSVALGRLFWLRIPLTLTLAVQRRLRTLLLGVAMQSLVWDGIYIALGIVGGRTVLSPVQMVLYSLAGLTLLYVVTFAVRRLSSRGFRLKRQH